MASSIPEVLEAIAKYLRDNGITGVSGTQPVSPPPTPTAPIVTPVQPVPSDAGITPVVRPLYTDIQTLPEDNRLIPDGTQVKMGDLILTKKTDLKGMPMWVDQYNFLRESPSLAKSPLSRLGAVTPENFVFAVKHKLDVVLHGVPGFPMGKVVAPGDPDYYNAVMLIYGNFDGLFEAMHVTRDWASNFYKALFAEFGGPLPAWYAQVFATSPA